MADWENAAALLGEAERARHSVYEHREWHQRSAHQFHEQIESLRAEVQQNRGLMRAAIWVGVLNVGALGAVAAWLIWKSGA